MTEVLLEESETVLPHMDRPQTFISQEQLEAICRCLCPVFTGACWVEWLCIQLFSEDKLLS